MRWEWAWKPREGRQKEKNWGERESCFPSLSLLPAHINLQADRADAATQEKCQLSD